MSLEPSTIQGEAVILNAQRIERCIQRIARQLLEDHHSAERVVISAIDGQGTVLAKRIAEALRSISKHEVVRCTLVLDKDAPLDHPVRIVDENNNEFDTPLIQGAVAVVVDDVLNSGRTLLHAVAHLLPFRPHHVGTCVLVDRIHRRFPVRADYVGKSLSTNLKAHIDVRLSGPGVDEAVLMDSVDEAVLMD